MVSATPLPLSYHDERKFCLWVICATERNHLLPPPSSAARLAARCLLALPPLHLHSSPCVCVCVCVCFYLYVGVWSQKSKRKVRKPLKTEMQEEDVMQVSSLYWVFALF